MKSLLHTTILSVLALALFIPAAHAETVVRTGEKVTLSDDQTVEGDFYGVAGPVSLSGTIDGDAYVIGGSVTTNGEIGADVFAVAGTVQLHASVTDDVRVVGGEVTIAEYVGGDVMVFGGVLTILSTSHIEGDVFFYGGEGEINGDIQGSVHGISEKLRIDGSVHGDIDVRAGTLVIGDRASIDGSVQYQSPQEIVRAQNAVIVGDIIRNDLVSPKNDTRDTFIPILIYAFSVLLILAVFRKHLEPILVETTEHFTRNGLIGLAGAIFIPGLVVLSFVTVIGSIAGLVVLFASTALWITSMLLVSIFAGLIVSRVLHKGYEVSLLWTLLGIVLVCLMTWIPVLGVLVLLVSTMAIFGTLLHIFYRKLI